MKNILIIFLISSPIFAQIDISRISIDLGYVRNYQFVDDYLYSFSPEIKLGGILLSDALEWEVHLSYWDDGIDEGLRNVMDHTTFSYSDFTFGSKIYFLPSQLKFHLLLNSGFSYKYITQQYIVGSQSPILNYTKYFNILSFDLGAGFRYNLNSKIRLRTEINIYIAIAGNVQQFNEYSNSVLKLGLDYFIK